MCQAGRFSATVDGNCDGTCEAGFYCAPGARSARDAPCPRSGDVFCPPGSERPRPVAAGFYALYDGALPVGEAACPRGSYCVAGKRLPCPAGTYGNVSALSTSGCSAACGGAGEYCPEGSLVPLKCPPGSVLHRRQRPQPVSARHIWSDGGVRRRALQRAVSAGSYCPAGSVLPTACLRERTENHRAQGPHMHGALSRGPLLSREQHVPRAVRRHDGGLGRLRQEAVLPGWRGSPASDTSRLLRYWRLPRGRSREAPCESGYRCHLGVRHACAPGTHEPAAGAEATQVDAAQCRPCPPGHYCPRGTGAAKPCPAGTYGNVIGNETGLSTAACSGPCYRGHYCPEGSVLPTPCPPGTFGNQTGLTTAACSAACFPDSTGECSPSQCEEGYYCPAGSTGRER